MQWPKPDEEYSPAAQNSAKCMQKECKIILYLARLDCYIDAQIWEMFNYDLLEMNSQACNALQISKLSVPII